MNKCFKECSSWEKLLKHSKQVLCSCFVFNAGAALKWLFRVLAAKHETSKHRVRNKERRANCRQTFYVRLTAPGPLACPAKRWNRKKPNSPHTRAFVLSSGSFVLFGAAAQKLCVYCISTCCPALFVVCCEWDLTLFLNFNFVL